MPYPENMPLPRRGTIMLMCPDEQCNHEWEADGVYDLGTFCFDNDDDELCPNCGETGE